MKTRLSMLAISFGLLTGRSMHAQAQSKPLPSPPPCSPRASIVSLLVHNAAGVPVPGTIVELVRVRDRKVLPNAQEMRVGKGEFLLFQNDAVQWVAAKGDSIRVKAHAGALSAQAIVVIGSDAKKCQLTKVSGPEVLVLK